jgi:hypothetical protein
MWHHGTVSDEQQTDDQAAFKALLRRLDHPPPDKPSKN